MKKSMATGIAFGCALFLFTHAQADKMHDDHGSNENLSGFNAVPLRDEKGLLNIDIGELRGIIEADEYAQEPDKVKIVAVSRHIVAKPSNLTLGNEKIDRIVTGNPYRNVDQGMPNLVEKFDANGQPMSHHQDYSAQGILSFATRLFGSLDANPYPGDK